MDLSNICLSCFSSTNGINPCPFCGNDRIHTSVHPQHLAPGSILNHNYLIGYSLGQGGFGVTYKGYDLHMQRVVAIKEYFPIGYVTRHARMLVLPIDENARAMMKKGIDLFFKEALILANFSGCSNIVNVLHFFRENNTAYIVMEYITGQSLKDYLLAHGNSLPFSEVQQILCPIMNALNDLHHNGLLHRDIAPDNIYLTADGQAKLLDFGAARFFAAEETQNAASVIKPGYAPLEQYSGRSGQGTWTDVYAMGATFYRALTGNVPISATDRAMGNFLPSPLEMGVQLPEAANAAIMKALSIKPEQRYASMADFEKDIYLAAEHSGAVSQTRTFQKPIQITTSARQPAFNPLPQSIPSVISQPRQQPIPQATQPPARQAVSTGTNTQPKKPGSTYKHLMIPLALLILLFLFLLGTILRNGITSSQSQQTPLNEPRILKTFQINPMTGEHE